jgi:protein-L-isoaspartate(D-aspartate) O-methyltransferase
LIDVDSLLADRRPMTAFTMAGRQRDKPSMSPSDMTRVRREFANRIAALAQLKSLNLVEALANVPREDFVGTGPWKVMRSPFAGGYVETSDADPTHLYDTVVVALDASRYLNNGEPSGLAAWLDALDVSRGVRFLHIGCGVGYYTAVVAHAVTPGTVLALEADSMLVDRARRNLAAYVNVEVRCATGPTPVDGLFDSVFVNAGATEVLPAWLERLADGGRLLVPLTTTRSINGGDGGRIGLGHMLRVERRTDSYFARFISPVGIFHCIGARTEHGEQLLRAAYQRGDLSVVQRLRLDSHDEQPTCWLHGSSFCLSRTAR